MISALIREFLVPLLVFLLLRSVLRTIFSAVKRSVPQASPPPPPPPPPQKEETSSSRRVLHKDPVCGTYVSQDACVMQSVQGKVLYFCSEECRGKYRS